MFGIGFSEMMIIGIVLLLAVGPRQLPALMKTVGKTIREVRRAAEDLRKSTGIDELLADEDLRNPLRDLDKPEYKVTPADREREWPREGVDVAHARVAAESEARVAHTGGAGPLGA